MASRQQEKEARKQARLEAEAAERKAQSRQKRLQLVLGGVLGIGAIVAVILVIASGGSGGASEDEGGGVRQAEAGGIVLPAQEATDFEAAAKDAGCELIHPKDEGREHAERAFTGEDYKTNPPSSGTHYPIPASDGVYDPGKEPDLGLLVHSLEHGRISLQYAPTATPQQRKELEALMAENGGYHMVMYENQTDMPYTLAATAWDQVLGCKTVSDKTWDAFRTFRDRYIDKGPEPAA